MAKEKSTVLLMLAAVLATQAVPVSPFLKQQLANCTADDTCVGVSTANCCSGKSHKTEKCGQDLECNFCKKAIGVLVTALDAVPDCSKLNFKGLCQDIVIGSVTILCEPFLYAACDLVLKDIKKGISDPAEVCLQLGNCGSLGSRCGCLPDGACNEEGDLEGCCSGTLHKVIQATCFSGNRCGCHSDGECMALGGPASDCCSGKAHHTAACAGGKRCGCLADGACLATNGGAASECCSGVGHWTTKCAGFRTCGPKLDDSVPERPAAKSATADFDRTPGPPPPVFDCRAVTDKVTCDSHKNPPWDLCGWCSTRGSNGTWSGCLPEYEIKKLPPTFDCGTSPTPTPTPTPTPGCSDHPPDSHSCAKQKEWGKCGESWMNGHCCKSCFNCQGCE